MGFIDKEILPAADGELLDALLEFTFAGGRSRRSGRQPHSKGLEGRVVMARALPFHLTA